jgi:serine/threonine-protein kinase
MVRSLPVPIVFGKYQLQRKLAEGGMAEVFLGRQAGMEGFEKLIVLKRIRPELSSDPSFVNMFLNEARVAARLNHPNIVQIFELGKVDKQYFIAMEFIHGEDLRSLTRAADLAKHHPSPGLVCRIIADTLAGLHYAHTRSGADGKPLGLVHRDVSPQNVLVTYEGAVKVVDFGIAKATRGGAVEQTRAGLFKGKFAYMSPEQSRGQPLDARSDIFAVGILLWELLTWTRLFKRANDMATLIAVAEEEIPSPLSFDSGLPPELERIVMKALDRRTHMRYLNANDMRAELEALIRKQGWEADSLALQNYMRGVFADKLRRQEEDIRESGFGSLEDFLLTVDEKSSVSWIKSVGVKTPSGGLPETRLPGITKAGGSIDPIGSTQEIQVMEPMPIVDSGGLELGGEVDELPGEATSFSPMPVFDEDAAVRKINPSDIGTADTAPVTEIPKELRPALFGTKKKSDAATLPPIQSPTINAAQTMPPSIQNRPTMPPMPIQARQTLPPVQAPANTAPAELQALPTAIVSRPSDLPSLPTAIVAPKNLEVTRPAPSPGPSATVELSPAALSDQATLSPNNNLSAVTMAMLGDPGRTLPPGGGMAAVALTTDPTIGTQAPRDPFRAGNTTAPRPIVDPPARRRWPFMVGGAAVLVLGIIAILVHSPSAPPVATLEINLDQPAVVSVDGKAEPITQKATVKVKPGVAHVVTVERDGKVVRTLNVPGMQPNEQLQLNVIVK